MNTTQNAKAEIINSRPLSNDIVRKHTAFMSGLELRKAMISGYVPTVSRKRQGQLLEALQGQGLPVFEVR